MQRPDCTSRVHPVVVVWSVTLCLLSWGCAFDRSGLPSPDPPDTCGNGVWDADEACDDAELGGQTCETQGYLGGGTLACTTGCTFDVSGCLEPEDCGDNVAQSSEECDGTDLAGNSCTSLGYDSGQLACTGLCTFDTQDCEGSICGDGVLDLGEACDQSDFGGATCVSLLHGGGVLQCTSTCTIDESACLDVVQGWYDAHWRYRKTITIFASQVVQDESDFPVVIALPNDAELLANAQSDGDDLLFTAADGSTKLAHEIERYDGASGSLLVWVKVPLLSSSTDTVLYLYYGYSSAGNQESPADVWDAQFTGVYHLLGNGTVTFEDSSGSGNDAVPGGFFIDQTVAGQLGPGQELNGTSQYIEIPAGATSGFDTFTYCFWVSTSESGSDGSYWRRPSLFGQSTNGAGSDDFGITTNSGVLGMWTGLGSGDHDTPSSETINDSVWHRICAVNDGNEIQLHLDDLGSVATLPSGGDVNSQAFWLGGRAGELGGGDFHQGYYDELQISSTDRSSEWIETSFRNQHQPGAFSQPGTEQYYLE